MKPEMTSTCHLINLHAQRAFGIEIAQIDFQT
jgi:hypothetical protein